MAKIKSIEYFRVLPRWLFVKIVDSDGNYGWGEATLEGHTEAVEGSLKELTGRFVGYEAELVSRTTGEWKLGKLTTRPVISSTSGNVHGG